VKLNIKNPLTGSTEQLGAGSIIGKLLWVISTVLIVALGQNIVNLIGSKSGGKLDTSIEPFIAAPAAAIQLPQYRLV